MKINLIELIKTRVQQYKLKRTFKMAAKEVLKARKRYYKECGYHGYNKLK